jgi:pimeloyl-ACP methyl ester carboxylesterase
VFEFGEGDEIVICAAGNGRPAAQFDEAAAQLADTGFRVVTFNYRGIGRSTGPLDGITLHDFANDVWTIADSLECASVHLLGKAYGNRVLRAASSDRPDRVATITLLAAGGEISPTIEIQTKFRRYFDPSISPAQLHAESTTPPQTRILRSRPPISGGTRWSPGHRPRRPR